MANNIDNFQKYLTCANCNSIYDSPVLLPCNETICKKDLHKFYLNTEDDSLRIIKCPFCQEIHQEPKVSFPENRIVKSILDASNANLNTSTQKSALENLKVLYQDYTRLKQNPVTYLEEFYEQLRAEINSNRSENKALLDHFYDDLIDEANSLELECKTKLNSSQPSLFSSDEEAYSVNDYFKLKIKNLNDEFGKFPNSENLKIDIENLNKKIENKIKTLKSCLLLNRNICLETKRLEKKQIANLQLNLLDQQDRKSNIYQQNPIPNKDLARKSSSELLSDAPASPTIKKSTNSRYLFIAKSDYEAKNSDELTFFKGDILLVKDEEKYENGIWMASIYRKLGKNEATRPLSGLVNKKYLEEYYEIESEPWYFENIDRYQAETLLKSEANKPGSFLVRNSTSDLNNQCYSLSVKDQNGEIKHYKIIRTVDDHGNVSYFINPKAKFRAVSELVDHYSKKPEGLCKGLGQICQRII